MYYVIFAQDKPNTLSQRLSVRPQHLARLPAQIPPLMMKILEMQASQVRLLSHNLILLKKRKFGRARIPMLRRACMMK